MNKYWTCEFCDFTHIDLVKVCLCSEALQKHHENKLRNSETLCLQEICELVPAWHCKTHDKTYEFDVEEFLEDTED